jgi:hypothetical protein
MATLTLTITRTAKTLPVTDLQETLFEATSIDGYNLDTLKAQWTQSSEKTTFKPTPWSYLSRSFDPTTGVVVTVFSVDLTANPDITEANAYDHFRTTQAAYAQSNNTTELYNWKQAYNNTTFTTVATTLVE